MFTSFVTKETQHIPFVSLMALGIEDLETVPYMTQRGACNGSHVVLYHGRATKKGMMTIAIFSIIQQKVNDDIVMLHVAIKMITQP